MTFTHTETYPAPLPLRPCVGVVLFNAQGLVLVGRHRPKWAAQRASYVGDAVWQLPQGGIEPREPSRETAFRELWEETGVRNASLIAEIPGWLTYLLPPELLGIALKGKYAGHRLRWYAMRFEGDDSEIDLFSFNRVDIDLQQYVPLVRDRRVLALHARAVMTDPDAGAEVPFYFQPTLGGPDDLRGFRHFRFRDRNTLLFQAEYRWEIFTAVDGAIFYDIGKVAPRRQDFNLSEFERDFGIGFRFGTSNGVFLRVEGAFGSAAGAHFVLRFGNVF